MIDSNIGHHIKRDDSAIFCHGQFKYIVRLYWLKKDVLQKLFIGRINPLKKSLFISSRLFLMVCILV